MTQFSLSVYAYPQSKSDITQWLSDINNHSKNVSFGICDYDAGKLIGYASIGTEVTKLVTHYGFNVLGLHRIELTVFSSNPAALKTYEKAGYVHEGVKREADFSDG